VSTVSVIPVRLARGEQSTELPGFSCFLRVDFMIMGQSGPYLAKPAHDHGA
jgi:hypothetical protein